MSYLKTQRILISYSVVWFLYLIVPLIKCELLEVNTCCDLKQTYNNQPSSCPIVLKPLNPRDRIQIWVIPSHLTQNAIDQSVSLVTKPPNSVACTEGQEVMNISISLEDIEEERRRLEGNLERQLREQKERIQFQENGYIMIGSRLKADYIHPSRYCIDSISPTTLSVRTCKPLCTDKEPCIRKCCLLHQLYNLEGRCSNQAPPNLPWTPKLYKKVSKWNSEIKNLQDGVTPIRYQIRSPPSWSKKYCKKLVEGEPLVFRNIYGDNFTHLLAPPEEVLEGADAAEDIEIVADEPLKARMGLDGKVRYRNTRRKWEEIPENEYCLDGITLPTAAGQGHVYKDTIDESILLSCAMEEESERQASQYYAALSIFCSFFALITVIAYFLLLDKQNIHGWTTMSHSTAVFCLFILLGVAHLTKEDVKLANTDICKLVAIVSHYFWVAVFCWLLVLSFDLWLTFRSLSVASTRRGVKRFMFYSLFGWGFPLLFIGFCLIMEKVYAKDPFTEVMVPMYGESFCYVSKYAVAEYVYIPSAILLVINIIFFLLTSTTLYKYQKSTKMATKSMQKDRQSNTKGKSFFRFVLFLKLFIVAGLLWLIELFTYVVSGAHIAWYVQILDTLNVLQPVFIFIIYVLKWEVIDGLHQKYAVLRPIVYPARATLQKCRKSQKGRGAGALANSESIPLGSKSNTETNVSRVSSSSDDQNVTNNITHP